MSFAVAQAESETARKSSRACALEARVRPGLDGASGADGEN
jgi:hypothetical protein